LAKLLLEKEVIFSENLEEIFGKRDFGNKTSEVTDKQNKLTEKE